MNRFLVRTALFAIIASPALSHADTFTLTWGSSNRQTLTFYLPPNQVLPPYLDGIGAFGTTLSLDGVEYPANLIFETPEAKDQFGQPLVGLLQMAILYGYGPPTIDGEVWGNNFYSDEPLIEDTSPGDPFLPGTHIGSFVLGSQDPATLVITPDASTVPEPSSLLLMATGLFGIGLAASRKSLF
jgi:hypothetical protein